MTHPWLSLTRLDSPFRAGLPDGSAIYGIVLHNYGSHTNGFVHDRHANICLDRNGEAVGMLDEHDTGYGNFETSTSDISLDHSSRGSQAPPDTARAVCSALLKLVPMLVGCQSVLESDLVTNSGLQARSRPSGPSILRRRRSGLATRYSTGESNYFVLMTSFWTISHAFRGHGPPTLRTPGDMFCMVPRLVGS